jgi:hypothetical protein
MEEEKTVKWSELAEVIRRRDNQELRERLKGRRLIRDGADGWSSCYPLHRAVEYEDGEMLDIFLEHGEDVNQNMGGYTPLKLACAHENPVLLEKLLAAGASYHLRKNIELGGQSPMFLLLLGEGDNEARIACIDTLARHGLPESFFQEDILRTLSNADIVTKLVSIGANYSIKDDSGRMYYPDDVMAMRNGKFKTRVVRAIWERETLASMSFAKYREEIIAQHRFTKKKKI